MRVFSFKFPVSAMTRRRILAAHALLARLHGPVGFTPGGDPLGQLVQTILSQNTSDVNSERAYRSLRRAFPTWQAFLDAPNARVAAAIRQGGLANIKAPRIRRALEIIRGREGKLSLARLRRMSSAEGMEYLTTMPGVGCKTAACVLLFSLGRPVMPVDTHVHRVTRRLGWAPAKARPEQVGEILEAVLPARLVLSMHLFLVRHGRRICKAQRPRCEACPLAASCDFARTHKRSE